MVKKEAIENFDNDVTKKSKFSNRTIYKKSNIIKQIVHKKNAKGKQKKLVKGTKEKKSSMKEKKMLFEVEGDNDDLSGEISVDLNEEPKIKGIEIPSNLATLQSGISNRHSRTKDDTINGNVYTKRAENDKNEENVSDEEETKVGLDEEIKYLKVKASKSVSQIKKGDKIKVDNLNLEVDSQYVLIDHGKTKEMAIELFDPKTDKDYQLRYFSDQVETSMEFYELDEIVYNKKDAEKVEW